MYDTNMAGTIITIVVITVSFIDIKIFKRIINSANHISGFISVQHIYVIYYR